MERAEHISPETALIGIDAISDQCATASDGITEASEMPGIEGLDNMDRTVVMMYSSPSWHLPLTKSAAIALPEIKAKLADGGK